MSSRGLADQRLGDRDALALSAGELRRAGGAANSRRVDGGQDLVDATALLGAGPAESPAVAGQPEQHRIARADRVARRRGVVLRHVADQVRSPRRAACRAPVHLPEATGIRPSTTCSSVVLPEPLDPITAVMPPAGTSKVPSDQISRPPRTTLTSSKDSAGSASELDQTVTPSALASAVSWSTCQASNESAPGRHRFGDFDHRDARRSRPRCATARAPNPRSGC